MTAEQDLVRRIEEGRSENGLAPPSAPHRGCSEETKAAKHTPSPWLVEWSKVTGRPLGIYAPGDNGIPGAVGSIVRRNGIGLPSSPVAVANAHLIAAAPDLLEALRRLLFDCKADGLQDRAGFDCWMAAADAAIAKAEGR